MVSNIFYFHPYLGKWSKLTNIFQMGWNHQLGNTWKYYQVFAWATGTLGKFGEAQEDLDISEPVLNCGFGGARSKDLLDAETNEVRWWWWWISLLVQNGCKWIIVFYMKFSEWNNKKRYEIIISFGVKGGLLVFSFQGRKDIGGSHGKCFDGWDWWR